MSARLADAAHKAVVGVLVGTTIVGLVDIGIDIPQRPNDAWDSPQLRLFAGFMHRSIMSQGKDEIAKREMEQLKSLRDQQTGSAEPFPEGTDLHSEPQQARI
ncbi:MAG: hypothetical protein CYPHOPRED_005194 [Cyphobasidiales sp. Tagirdzhanova-0007]|nr:MAG: hypothetical protein CYPHOPRED_005194 [Cyphobasidiales sp. Tagirdzhanova-0007]